MNIDDLGRRAGHDLQRTSSRLEANLPSAPGIVAIGRRLRARRWIAGLAVLLVLLTGSVAFAAVGSGDDGRSRVSTDNPSTVPSNDDGPSSTSPTDSNPAPIVEPCGAVDEPEANGEDGRTHCTTTTTPDSTGGDDDSTPTSTAVSAPPADNATTPTTPDPDSNGLGRVSGHVLAGPTCPVETPDQSCDDVGIVATITFTMIRDDAELLYERTVTSAPDGSYSINLAPGHFSVAVTSAAAMSCSDATVTVIEDEAVTLDLSCDTGIR